MTLRKSLLAALALLLLPAAAPVFAGGEAETAVKSEVENIEFLAWWAKKFHPEDANLKQLGKLFKANLTITTIPHNVYFDQLNTKIAAKDLPVMYKYQLPAGYAFKLYNEMIGAKRLENLTPLIEKYKLDNLKSYLAKPGFAHLVGTGGEKYAMPIYIAASADMIYVRQDWLDQLGLKKPSTWDELRDVARAIKRANPSGKVTAGIGGYITGLIYSSFTEAAGDFTNHQGKWIFRPFHPQYKEAVRYITEMYKEGILHPTSLDSTHGPNERMKLFIDENEGMMMHNGLSSHFAQIVSSLTQINPKAKVDYIPYPANRAGKIVAPQGVPYYGVDTIDSSHSLSEKVKALQILDYLHSPAGHDLMFDGVEGVHYKVVDGKKVHDPELRKRDFIGAASPLIEISDLSFPFEREVPQLKANFFGNAKNIYSHEVIGLTSEAYLNAVVKMNEVVDIYLPRFYSGQMDVDKDWDKFLAELRKNDYDVATAEVEKFMKK